MASIGDYVFLFIVLAIIGGIAYAVKAPAIKEGISGAQNNLKNKGISFNEAGVSVKTNRRAPTREEYLDATQKRLAKGGEVISQHKEAFTTTAWQRAKEEQEAKERAAAVGGYQRKKA
ncbi:unnamed protein product [Sympodiomycopsis kandeliae]